eukprot:scaffold27229_cov146-Isochrysis_galbana.AAC.2
MLDGWSYQSPVVSSHLASCVHITRKKSDLAYLHYTLHFVRRLVLAPWAKGWGTYGVGVSITLDGKSKSGGYIRARGM